MCCVNDTSQSSSCSQFVFYSAWGCILAAQALLISSYSGGARPALLIATLNVITSGFIANSVFTQLIESGNHPGLIVSIQTIPAMALYRGKSLILNVKVAMKFKPQNKYNWKRFFPDRMVHPGHWVGVAHMVTYCSLVDLLWIVEYIVLKVNLLTNPLF